MSGKAVFYMKGEISRSEKFKRSLQTIEILRSVIWTNYFRLWYTFCTSSSCSRCQPVSALHSPGLRVIQRCWAGIRVNSAPDHFTFFSLQRFRHIAEPVVSRGWWYCLQHLTDLLPGHNRSGQVRASSICWQLLFSLLNCPCGNPGNRNHWFPMHLPFA